MNQEKKNLIVFGYGLGLILSFFGLRLFLKHGLSPFVLVLLILALGFILVTSWRHEVLKPFYEKWMKAARFIGHYVSLVILSILFYGVFTVVGIILRILKKDLLKEKFNPQSESYWLKKNDSSSATESYPRQF